MKGHYLTPLVRESVFILCEDHFLATGNGTGENLYDPEEIDPWQEEVNP